MIHLLGICAIKGRGITHVHLGYDPKTDSYVMLPSPKLGRQWAVCAYYKGKIYLISGYTLRKKACITGRNEVYDVKQKRWYEAAPLPLKYRRYGCGRENPIINGRIYVTHGQGYRRKGIRQFFCGNLVYNIVTNQWGAGKSAYTRRDGAGCAVTNGKLHVIGGRDNGPEGIPHHEVYDPKTNKWRFKNPLPENRADISCVVFNGEIYCFGGYGGEKPMGIDKGNVNNNVYVYNPKTDLWREVSPMPTARWGPIAVTDGKKIYVFGGGVTHHRRADKTSDILEVYNPITDKWEKRKPMPIVTQGLMGVFVSS